MTTVPRSSKMITGEDSEEEDAGEVEGMLAVEAKDGRSRDYKPEQSQRQISTPDTAPGEEAASWPTPPAYQFYSSFVPSLAAQVEAERTHGARPGDHRGFFRSIKWSPDGSHLLAVRDDHRAEIYALRQEGPNASSQEAPFSLVRSTALAFPTPLQSIVWWPFAQSYPPDQALSTFIVASSARDLPIKLHSAYGEMQTRASYGVENHVEKFVGPSVLAFSIDGTRLYGGLPSGSLLARGEKSSRGAASRSPRNVVISCSLERQGNNEHQELPLHPSHHGSISCITVRAEEDGGSLGTTEELLAVGTWRGVLGLYRASTGSDHAGASRTRWECVALFQMPPRAGSGCMQLLFHPTAPHLLFALPRRSTKVFVYDMRYLPSPPASSSDRPDQSPRTTMQVEPSVIFSCTTDPNRRTAARMTQQRRYGEIDWGGRYFLLGDEDGDVHVWDVTEERLTDLISAARDGGIAEGGARKGITSTVGPVFSWKVGNDAVGAVAMHPSLPIVASVCGSRGSDWDADEEDEAGDEVGKAGLLQLWEF